MPAYDGVAAPVVATVPKATLAWPLACSGSAGTAPLWHSLQATCLDQVGPPAPPVRRCFSWAPIFVPPVRRPATSAGGAAEKAMPPASRPVRDESPWQDVQVCSRNCTVPSTWVEALTVVLV